jgi:hypothetical protein
VGAVGRGEDVALVQRLADADGDRLLPDRDVQEPGQLACAEALLDLLLETPDEEHLAQEIPQPFLAQRAFPLNLRHEAEFMLSPVRLVDEWRAIQNGLPEGWGDARLRLTVADPGDSDRAAALLGPANPGRHGRVISFYAARRGAGPSPELVRRLLARLDAEGIEAELELRGSGDTVPAARVAAPTFVGGWDAALAALPDDWSDLYAEVELASSDYLERAALLLAPVNPSRHGGKPSFRFRAARSFGYGASPEMARRCLARLDVEGIRGAVRVLWALSETRPVQTQGPVWYVGGRSV